MGTVTITQHLRPDGRPREMTADVPDEYSTKAEGMRFSSEVLTTGQVAIYAKWEGQHEDKELMELATNGPGPDSPNNMLLKLIDRLAPSRQIGRCPSAN